MQIFTWKCVIFPLQTPCATFSLFLSQGLTSSFVTFHCLQLYLLWQITLTAIDWDTSQVWVCVLHCFKVKYTPAIVTIDSEDTRAPTDWQTQSLSLSHIYSHRHSLFLFSFSISHNSYHSKYTTQTCVPQFMVTNIYIHTHIQRKQHQREKGKRSEEQRGSTFNVL